MPSQRQRGRQQDSESEMHGSGLVAQGYGRVIGVKVTRRRRTDERLFAVLVVVPGRIRRQVVGQR